MRSAGVHSGEVQAGSSSAKMLTEHIMRFKRPVFAPCDKKQFFWNRNSLVQETVEAAGHLCLFFPKFHCELNFIEFFWAQVKKYLRDNCDFDTLKENMPKALESVPLATICRWEHRMYRWMEAYRSRLGTSAAQLQVRRFGSAKYKSH